MIYADKKKPPLKKIQAYRRGLRAEIFAALYLIFTGWRVLAWRWKCPLGEIDLVAKKGKIITFIEVKARQSEKVALDSLTTRQWRRISNAAEMFMARHPDFADCSWRFDAIIIVSGKWPRRFENIWHE